MLQIFYFSVTKDVMLGRKRFLHMKIPVTQNGQVDHIFIFFNFGFVNFYNQSYSCLKLCKPYVVRNPFSLSPIAWGGHYSRGVIKSHIKQFRL